MDELVKRLRSVQGLDKDECDAFTREAMLDAADEIERLRAGLRTLLETDHLEIEGYRILRELLGDSASPAQK